MIYRSFGAETAPTSFERGTKGHGDPLCLLRVPGRRGGRRMPWSDVTDAPSPGSAGFLRRASVEQVHMIGFFRRQPTILILILICFALAACDATQQADEATLMERAREYRASGELSAAIIELRNVVQRNPENGQAQRLLGETYLESGDDAQASKHLEQAKQNGEDDPELRLGLGQAWLRQGRYRSVLALVPEQSYPQDKIGAGLAMLRAEALLATGSVRAAEATFQTALALDGESGAEVGLARIALARSEPATAEGHIKSGLERRPEDPILLTLEGNRLLLMGEAARADEAFAKAIAAQPDAAGARIGSARAKIALGRHDEAEAALAAIEPDARQSPGISHAVSVLQAVISFEKRDYAAARTHAEQALGVDGTAPTALYIAGASAFALEQNEQAHRFLSTYLAKQRTDKTAVKLLAATLMRLGQADQAYRTLAENATDTADAEYMELTASAALLSGDMTAGVHYFEQAVIHAPEDAELRARLGSLRVALGNEAEGTVDLEEATRIDPKLDSAEVALVIARLRQQDFDEALEAARRLQEHSPDAPTGFVLAGIALGAMGRTEEARQSFERALEISPGEPNAAANLAVLSARAGDLDAARTYYELVLERRPSDLRTLLSLAALEEKAGRTQERIAWLQRAIEGNPQAPEPRLLLGRTYLAQNDPGRALEAVSPSGAPMPTAPALLEVAGQAHMRLGRYSLAADAFRALTEAEPTSAAAYRYLATAFEAAADPEQALIAIEKAADLTPEDHAVAFTRARLLAATGRYEEASRTLSDLKADGVDDPLLDEMEGNIALATQRHADAAAAYQAAFERRKTNFLAVRLAKALALSGREDEAQATLSQWLDEYPEDFYTRLARADLHLDAGRLEQAESDYREVVRLAPDSVLAHNNLAWVLLRRDNPREALEHARTAHGRAPRDPQVLDTLGLAHLALSETDEALRWLNEAASLSPDDQGIGIHLADALARKGDSAAARTILTDILSRPQSPSIETEARTVLSRVEG